MSVSVTCPACESRFQLQEEILGKQMRCPVCRETFLAQVAPVRNALPVNPTDVPPSGPQRSGDSRMDMPKVPFTSGHVGELIPILQTEPEIQPKNPMPMGMLIDEAVEPPEPKGMTWSESSAAPPVPKGTEAKSKELPRPITKTEPQVREVVWSKDVVPPSPKEVVWSEELAPPPPTKKQFPEEDPDEIITATLKPDDPDVDDEYAALRRSRRQKRLAITVVLGIVVLLSGYVGFGYLQDFLQKEPSRIFARAKKEYEESRPAPAAKLFDEIVRRFPDNDLVPEAKFFVELCNLRTTVYSVTNASNPTPALEQLKRFLTAVESPELNPFTTREKFGSDIWQTLQKLAEDTLTKGTKDFNQDKPDEAEYWLKQVDELGNMLANYRPREVGPETVLQDRQQLRQKIFVARQRLAFFEDVRQRLTYATDDLIRIAKEEADKRGHIKDPAFVQILQDAEKRMQGRVTYTKLEPPVPPQVQPASPYKGLLSVPQIQRSPIPAAPGPSTVFFGLARGILYALDEVSGQLLWATRIGIDCDVTPLHLPATDQHPEMVLVIVNDGAESRLTARNVRDGSTIWSQALSSPVLGQPVHVGNRLYVSTREKLLPDAAGRPEESGLIWELEIGNGYLLGKISLGRPLGTGGVRRGNTGLIYFPAEAKSVYVFDVDKQSASGERQPPTFLGVINTDHIAGTLRCPPILTNAELDSTNPTFLILCQSDGLNEVTLKAFPLPTADGSTPILPRPSEAIRVQGWNSFLPYADNEKVAVVTDRGEFNLLGISQPNNRDAPLFRWLEPLPLSLEPKLSRSQVVYAEENLFWVLAGGSLHQVRLGLDAKEGMKWVRRGGPLVLGDPTQPAQLNERGDSCFVVTQSPNSTACVASAVDLTTGQIRWQRQLGLLVHGEPIRFDETHLLFLDRDGGIYKVDINSIDPTTEKEWIMDERWQIAAPLLNVVHPSTVLRPADQQVLLTMTTVQTERGQSITLRRYAAATDVQQNTISLPAQQSGKPIVLGNYVLIPLSNGSLYRVSWTNPGKLEEGPTWRTDSSTQASCFLAALNEEELVSHDGSRVLTRWFWPTNRSTFENKGRITWKERLLSEPLVLRKENTSRVLLADTKGIVSLWDLNKPSAPLRSWRSNNTTGIPEGLITTGPFRLSDTEEAIGYVVAGAHLVRLNPDQEKPLWISKRAETLTGDGLVGPPTRIGNQLLITDRSGWMQFLEESTGQRSESVLRPFRTFSPTAPTVSFNHNWLFSPQSDGTILLLPKTP